MENIIERPMKFAVLIDSDNLSQKYANTIFDEIEKYGEAPERKIYGDWNKKSGWNKNTIVEHALTPVQQFAYTTGKNSTDITLVIDAMDILYKNKVDGFCLVTNDSDFTRLATRLREDGKTVIGMGVGSSANSLIKACNKFIYLNLVNTDDAQEEPTQKKDRALTDLSEIKNAITEIISTGGTELTDVSLIGKKLSEKFSDFDTRNYGFSQLGKLLENEFKDTLKMEKNGSRLFVKRNIKMSEKDLRSTVIKFINTHGGKIQNMSLINDELKKQIPDFDLHDYGYSRFSSYLRAIPELTVDGSEVSVKVKLAQ